MSRAAPERARLIVGGPLSGKSTRLVQAYAACLRGGLAPDRILCLSFFPANAHALRRGLRSGIDAAGEFLPWVTTLQRFQTLFLRDHAGRAGLPARAQEIGPEARSLILQRAWAAEDGPLWREFGERPGAMRELTRVIDWISANRTAFAVAAGEFSDGELARVYTRYIDLCARHGWLTFQEASLRCLDLLAADDIAVQTRARFDAVLVDDLHLARPDQLALIARLRGPVARFTATAWLAPDHAAPELRHVWETLQAWADCDIELLQGSAPGVNPSVAALAARLHGVAADSLPGAQPIRLRTPFTAEDELQAMASALAAALAADPALQPGDVIIAAADADLLPFAQRVLRQRGLPAPALEPAIRHTPLLRGALLVLQWLLERMPDESAVDASETPRAPGGGNRLTASRRAVERELLALPFLRVDALDVAALDRRAAQRGTTILDLPRGAWPPLADPDHTGATVRRARRVLRAMDPARPVAGLVRAALCDLGALAWAWESADFPRAQRDRWARALVAWLDRVAELERVVAVLGTRPEDFLELAAGLADEALPPPQPAGTVQLADLDHANGVHGRLAFVVGLSENAVPALHAEMQLVPERELPGLFADGRAVVLPAARPSENSAAWIEREGRRLAALLTRGTETLHVSVSRFSAAGDAQLPSPFFERLLAGEGEIDRDGVLRVAHSRVWVHAAADLPPERPVTPPREAEPARPVLGEHTYSASQLRSYLACPLQFFYARVLGLESEGTLVLQRGSLMHAVLCVTVGDGRVDSVDLTARPRPVWLNDVGQLRARARAALQAVWTGAGAALPGGGQYEESAPWAPCFGQELQQRAVHDWAAGVIEDWAAFEVNGPFGGATRRPVWLEVPFDVALDGYHVTGRIDRIDAVDTPEGTVYELIDYKTGAAGIESAAAQVRKFLPETEEPPKDYQLPLYALALQLGAAGLQALPRRMCLVNVEHLEPKGHGYKAAACRTVEITSGETVDYRNGRVPADTLENAVRRGIVATLEQMAASPYPARPEYHRCQWCAFRVACDRGRAQAGLPA